MMKSKLYWGAMSIATCFLLLSSLKSFGLDRKLFYYPSTALARDGEPAVVDEVSGKVTGSDGKALADVSIMIKDSKIGTKTDDNGAFTIKVEAGQILIFSSVGHETKEVTYNNQTQIDVVLADLTTQLDDVIVEVGYGTQKKVTLTSAISEISGKDLVRRPVSSVQQALQGKLPGLTVLDKGGSPGSSNASILIRGVNTPYTPVGLSTGANAQVGDNGPLVIVDGVEQPYQNINPNDIDNISVLKDASSTAIYGSRAANGVILITTKRGKTGKVTVTYDGFYATQKSILNPKHMDIESYLRLQNTALENVGSAPKYSQERIKEYTEGSITDPLKYPLPFDWYNVLLKTAPQINNSISVAGGTDKFKARLSARYQDQQGIITNTSSRLTEMRLTTDYKISQKLSIAADLNYRYQMNFEPNNINEIFRQLMQNSIWDVPKYPNGDYGGGAQGNNPLLLAEKGGYNNVASDYVIGNIKGTWEIIKGLSFSTQFAGRFTSVSGKNFINTWETRDSTTVKKRNLHNSLSESRNSTREFTLNNILNYALKVAENHSFKLLAGYSQIANRSNSLSAYRQDFYNNDVQSIGQGIDDATKDNGGGDAEWGLRSYFGRFNYAFKEKYLFEANSRYDGSSRFTGDNKYSFFPSFSGGWRISKEKFWEDLLGNTVNELKLRGSWGRTGNQAVALYSYYSTLNLVNYNFGGSPVQGYVQKMLANPDLTWETTTQTDIGLDGQLFNGQIDFGVDYYKKRTDGILLTLPVPGALGMSGGPQNAGIVENKGWEFTLGSRNRFGAVSLDAMFNLSINQNKVIDLEGTGPYIYGDDIDPRYITQEGLPINSFWGYKTDGLFQSDAEAAAYPQFMRPAKAGDVKVLDLNKDGKIDPSDMTYLKNSFPKYTFGAGFNIAYKSISVNIALQGAADVGMRYARALAEAGNYEGFTPDIYTNNYWTPEHTDARFARPTKQDLRNQASTDRMILDASYLRVKNIQVVYQLPTSLTRKAFIDRASIYISGTNLFTFSKLNEWGLDPEASSGWQNYYPQTSLYTVGFNLQF
ncbi:MAG TPA: TonB-dependent receptor [Arachidicoccus sp.]|nr:TonB-dependent receptor [Arachidicoccus sp.]